MSDLKNNLSSLEPSGLWNNFAKLNSIPRASKKEEQVIQFMKSFGESLGLKTVVDHIGNVIIRKPGTKGNEEKPTIVMQSHLDMVHQKNADTDFDFATEGIKMYIDGDWVKARGTTLGADNGIGVATIMALLESNEIPHPPLEALFTIDEETGMTGALELKGGMLKGEIMLNLDTEDDRELTIGCAGGIDITGKGTYSEEVIEIQNYASYSLKISGLTGGHSGMDIHIGRGNANKIANRILNKVFEDITDAHLHSIDGGGLRNAIPRESVSRFSIPVPLESKLKSIIEELSNTIYEEYKITDPSIKISIEEIDQEAKVIPQNVVKSVFVAINGILNGIYRMSPSIEGLVQTSNNLARLMVGEGKIEILCLTRSSVDSEKMALCTEISSILNILCDQVNQSGSYPGWTPNPDAKIVKLMTEIYRKRFNEEPHVNACHAGLECGILGQNYPEMEMISFGPNIQGAHSPDEKVQISSVQKYWGFLMETLKAIS